jgi:alkyl sulfatase BDS1-like metallo-beta-lactamase superfamily hydrolase
MSEFREITDLPVKAIVYTHHHLDHVYGAAAFAEESNGDLEIYAHDNLMKRISEENGELGTATAFRGIYWAGAMLPEEGPDRLVSAGLATPIDIGGTTGFVPPTITFDDRLETEVAGLKMELIYTPSETSNEIVVWFPELQVLQGAEVLYELWPNLYSIRGTQYRDVKAWIDSLETMRELQAEIMVLSHTYPVIGRENVNGVLTTYHDAVQYIYDQTIRGINKGMTPNELVQTIKLPDSLLNSPYSDWLQERYGEREWHIKGIYSGNQGWYNNDVMNLHPIPFEEKSAKIVEGFGGVKKTLQAVRTAIDDKEYTWALELATYVMKADPDNEEAKLLKAFTSRILGHLADTATSRNMYLTTAHVLEGKIIIDASLVAINDPNQVAITPIGELLSLLPAKLDPQKAEGMNRIVGLYFTDVDEGYTIHVRNSIAAFKDVLPENYDVLMTTDTDTFKKAITGEQSIIDSIELNEIQIDGNTDDFIEVLNMFDSYTT